MTDVEFQTHVGNYAPPDAALMHGLGMLGLTDSGVPSLREREGRVTATNGAGHAPGQPWEPTRGIPSTEGVALCATTDPEMWFPETGQAGKAKEAKSLCLRCPIRQQCSADSAGEKWGIWAGQSVNERTRRRAKRVAPPEMERAHTVDLPWPSAARAVEPAPKPKPKPKPKKRLKRKTKRPAQPKRVAIAEYDVVDVPLLDLVHPQCMPNADCEMCWPDD